ncbi:phospholipase D-like domain-containing protein [Engelhardtia mirabilis]|uniref:phospholipase D-like domain-containing protein n=1 Tax=Engelhardtia mirabilis TaxID=2528011 RepID=UPI0011A2C57C
MVESAPVGTSLDAPDLRNAGEVWVEMIDAARSTLDLAFFYVSDNEPSRLTAVIEAIERATSRGVRVRLLLSAGFRANVPETVERLSTHAGIELRWLDLKPLGLGVLHAKYFIVDGASVFVGSQNFDWRSLEHIQELGLRVRDPDLGAAFEQVFEFDWTLAASGTLPSPAASQADGSAPVGGPRHSVNLRGSLVEPVFSPLELLPEGLQWDLPRLIELIDGATATVRVQLLSYRLVGYDGEYFDDLDRALRRAAARGVDVRLIVADWEKRPGAIEDLKSLQPVRNVEVRMLTIPPAEQGHIPYARVVHAKYLVVDGQRAWVGTSNWSRDYFHSSRNAGLVLSGGDLPPRLDQFHAEAWNSEYAFAIDPCEDYEPARIGD